MDSHKVGLTDEITAIRPERRWDSLGLGYNGYGQLGNRTYSTSNVPVTGCLRPAIKKSRYAFDFLDVMPYIDSRS